MSRPARGSRVTPKGTRPKNHRPKLNEMAARAMTVQEQVARAKAEAAETVVYGKAHGDAVVVAVYGDWQPKSVTVSPSLLDSEDVDMLDDFLLIAMRNAHAAAKELQEQMTSERLDEVGGLDLRAMGLDNVL